MPEGGDRRWAQTLPSEQWTAGANAATATPPVGGATAQRDGALPPRMRGLSLTERLREHGYSAEEPTGERFAVHGVLGDGATARVYEVHDRNLGRDVAVKVLKTGDPPDRSDVARFVDEARTNA